MTGVGQRAWVKKMKMYCTKVIAFSLGPRLAQAASDRRAGGPRSDGASGPGRAGLPGANAGPGLHGHWDEVARGLWSLELGCEILERGLGGGSELQRLVGMSQCAFI